jgi:hypothetical protein
LEQLRPEVGGRIFGHGGPPENDHVYQKKKNGYEKD